MSQFYIKTLQDYLRQLCVEHTLLLHNDDSNVVFIRFQSQQDVSSIPNNASPYFVIVDDFIGRAIGDIDDTRLRQQLTLLFVKRCKTATGNVYQEIEKAQQDALEIMFDFNARLKQDYVDDDCGPLRYLKPEQMSFEPVDGPVEEYHYGWLMTIPFDVDMPSYNAEKWNR